MKFICDKEQLLNIVNIVQKSIASKSTSKLLECMKIETTQDGNIIVTGTNTDVYIEYNAQFNVFEGGTVALESKMFGEIVRRLPYGNVTITVNPENYITKIQCGLSEFNIQGLDTNGFPSAPIIDDILSFKIKQHVLKNLIRKTISFAAVNEGKKAILTGELFEIKNNILNVVSSDGHRMAAVREELTENVNDAKFVVHGETLRKLLTILSDDKEDDVLIKVSEKNILFDFNDFQVYTRILDGEFLNYEAILSANNSIMAEVNKNDITDSLERAILLVNEDISSKTENKVPVRFSIGFDKIDISCITGRGQVSDSVDANISGGELLIGFNCKFLIDAMSGCDEEIVKMEFSTPTGGCFIRDSSGKNSYVYMILPVRLYN